MYFDTVVRFIGRTRRYLLTATDHAGRFAVAIAVPRHDSHHAARFAALVQTLFPGRIRQILTDNRLPMYYGSEFQGAFAACARAQGWRHCHTWPRSPKMNAFNERFNRTVQTDFVDYEKDCLLNDLRLFNERLPGFLDRYDGQRPHQGLNYQTPCQMLAQHLPHLSHMWWHHTYSGLDTQIHVRLLSQWWYSDGAAGASLPFSPVSKRHQHFNLFLATTKREQQ